MTRRRLVALVLGAAAVGSLATTLAVTILLARLFSLDALQHARACATGIREVTGTLLGAGFVTLVAAVLLYPTTEAP